MNFAYSPNRQADGLIQPATIQRVPLQPVTALSIALVTLCGVGATSATAQITPPGTSVLTAGQAVPSQPMTGYLLFVNPAVGNDGNDGSQRSPLRTLTRALAIAQPNSIILLSPGVYSADSGESFPLVMRPGVTIQGDPAVHGQGIVLRGGGEWARSNTRAAARPNVTLVGSAQAALTGVTVTNPTPGGYGLWIEGNSPAVMNNTLANAAQDGVMLSGDRAPLIQGNRFSNPVSNPVSNSLSNPLSNQTASAIATPVRPRAQPLAAVPSIPFGAPIPETPIPSASTSRTSAPSALSFVSAAPFAPAPRPATPASASSSLPRLQPATPAAPAALAAPTVVTAPSAPRPAARPVSTSRHVHSVSPSASTIPGAIDIPVPPPASASPTQAVRVVPAAPAARTATVPLIDRPIDIPVPPPATRQVGRGGGASPQPQSARSPVPAAPTVISRGVTLPAPQPALQPVPAPRPAAPVRPSNLLPVPDPDVPLGNIGGLPTITVPRSAVSGNASRQGTGRASAPNPNLASALGLQYRVLVDAPSDGVQSQVRSLIPGAFRTMVRGRTMMQVGAFSTRDNASAAGQLLEANGFQVWVEPVR